MDDMSTSTLSLGLAELERAKLVHRRVFAEIPTRVEYTLTKVDDKLRKSLFSLYRFASRK
jgi:DNA-binding HxlR family transcriptional regulator